MLRHGSHLACGTDHRAPLCGEKKKPPQRRLELDPIYLISPNRILSLWDKPKMGPSHLEHSNRAASPWIPCFRASKRLPPRFYLRLSLVVLGAFWAIRSCRGGVSLQGIRWKELIRRALG